MSEDGASSTAGFSDEGNASLVGFGEGASSTVSGPAFASTRVASGVKTALAGKQDVRDSGSPMRGVQTEDAMMVDGMTYDRDVVDTMPRHAGRGPATAQEEAEYVIGNRLHGGLSDGKQPLGSSRNGERLGRFSFETEQDQR